MKTTFELALANLAKRLALLALAGSAALLAACGGGGTSDSASSAPVIVEVPGTPAPGQGTTTPVAAPLAVATASLPAAQAGAAYEARLQARNTTAPVAWSLAAGQLPAGLALAQDGLISGQPVFAGLRTFTVRAEAAGQAVTRSLAIAVDAFGILVVDGLEDGIALTDRAIAISAVGAVGEVRFEVAENGSGGVLGLLAGHEATWRTGTVGGAVDAVRAIDLATGASAELRFEVRRDLAAGYVAEPGSDVWYVDTSRKSGPHAFATDFQAALAMAGLRQAGSTSLAGREADRLAELAVRLRIHQHLNRIFLRNADGSRGAGLAISFPWEAPVGAQRAAEGAWLAGGANRFSVMNVGWGSQAGVMGSAFLDSPLNLHHENNSVGGAAGELGVFPNRFMDIVNLAYSNSMVASPLVDGDAEILAAMLYGAGSLLPRAQALETGIEAVGRSIAQVLAHEIGHSLGLQHPEQHVAGAVMNATPIFSPSRELGLLPADVAALQVALPGAGRLGAVAGKVAALPAGGVVVN